MVGISIFKGHLGDIVKTLEELKCCNVCILRCIYQYEVASEIDFLQPEKSIQQLLDEESSQEGPSKKIKHEEGVEKTEIKQEEYKKRFCSICLGILDINTIERYLNNVSDDFKSYDFDDFSVNITLPKSAVLRNKSVLIYLQEKFPDINFYLLDLRRQCSIKEVFKIIAEDSFSKKLNKLFVQFDSSFKVEINIWSVNDTFELEKINSNPNHISQGIVNNIIKMDSKEFKKFYPVPPVAAVVEETNAVITVRANTMFIGGRYMKFVRNIGQTPWVINDRAMTEDCVQDIMFDSINKILGIKHNMTFSSSGREDADVRMLGDGRPFYIQIEDPKMSRIFNKQFRDIEEDILKSKMIGVIKLQKVEIKDLKKIKDGECEKEKTYKAICHTTAPSLTMVVEMINKLGATPIAIVQRTPLRVLHRRTLVDRQKVIHSIKASIVPGHSDLIEIDLVTQAGTYVKEFVHGDFYRTEPSLASIINYPIDIVALDVTSIKLEWP